MSNKTVSIDRSEYLLNEDTPFNIKEAYKSTRTNIIFSMQDEGCKRILVTSPFPKEGKTTTCLNLAITFAQTGARVLIIDADLRKPRLHKMLKATSNIGITNVLSGVNSLSEAVQETSYENLSLLVAGHIPPNPVELLSSNAMEELLKTLSEYFDYIFIDTPPVNVVTDAIVLSSLVTGVYLVVRQGLTEHRALKEAISKFEFTNIKPLGFILNDIDESVNKYRYRYKYGYKKYGYSKYGYQKYGYKY